MPSVSTTPAVPMAKLTAGVVDTIANLPPLSLIPVVHLDLQISLEIFEKFRMTLMLFSGGWGKMIHERNLKQKIS